MSKIKQIKQILSLLEESVDNGMSWNAGWSNVHKDIQKYLAAGYSVQTIGKSLFNEYDTFSTPKEAISFVSQIKDNPPSRGHSF